MPAIKLSDSDRQAVILKKLITPGVADPPYEYIDHLDYKFREVVHTVLEDTGKDKAARSARLVMELVARGMLVEKDQVERADPHIDLSAAEISDTWKFVDLADAYELLPTLQWVVRGLISRPSVNIFYGRPKSLKSLLLLDMCFAVASGMQWLPGLQQAADGSIPPESGFDTEPTITGWLDFENGDRRMRERFSAMGRARELSGDTNIRYVSMPTPWLDAGKSEHIGRLMMRIETYGFGLLVIDHLAQILGSVDENTSEMAEIMGKLRGLAEEMNLALVLIHHQIKGSQRYGFSDSDSLRGHGSILASVDLAAVVQRGQTNSELAIVRPAAVRGAGIEKFSGLFTYEHKDDGSKELERARFWGMAVESIDDQIDEVIAEVLDGEPGLNQTNLRAAIREALEDVSDAAARRAIARNVQAGRISERPGNKGAKLYYLPED